jgi:chemotaxis protein MotA
VGSANIFFLPAASKLRARNGVATLLNEVTLEGVLGIVEGLNPSLLRTKLSSFAPPGPGQTKAPASAVPSRTPGVRAAKVARAGGEG